MRKTKLKSKKVYYLLPLEWSLYYIMTKKEWQDFRNRVKRANTKWYRCSCPKHCRATILDEQWKYIERKHIKKFIKAKFICSGCHWLKSPNWRMETWLKQEMGELPPKNKIPHIIDCLGWTEKEVEDLREKDLQRYFEEIEKQEQINQEVKKGMAQVKYWSIDLKALKRYGYSKQEITAFEKKFIKDVQEKIGHDKY